MTRDERPASLAAGRSTEPGSPVGVTLVAGLLACSPIVGAALFLGWWILVPAAISTAAGYVLLGRFQRGRDDRPGDVGFAVPNWLVAGTAFTVVLLGLLVATGRMDSVLLSSAALLGFATVPFLAGLLGGRTYRRAFRRMYLSKWFFAYLVVCLAVVGSAHAFTVGNPTQTALGLAFTLLAFQVWFVIPVATWQWYGERDVGPAEPPFPSLSVVIPAYNEERYVSRCIERVLAAEYPDDLLEVVVIDDGSTDDTYAEAASYRDEGVEVYSKENGGKYSALNYGMLCTSGDVVVCVDADSRVAPDALRQVVGAFQAHEHVGAVAGTVNVYNRDRTLTKLQALEYLVGINTFRRAFSYFGAVPLVPGCLSAFRRRALEDAGGFDPDTATEDFDVTLQVLKAGWEVRQTKAAVWTEVPFTFEDLYDQRKRWYTGQIQTLVKHADALVRDDSGYLHRLAYPLYFLRLLVTPVVNTFIRLTIFAALLVTPVLVVAGLGVLAGSVMLLFGVLVVRMAGSDDGLALYAPLFRLGYTQFMELVLLVTVGRLLLTGDDVEWHLITRQLQAEGDRGPLSDPT